MPSTDRLERYWDFAAPERRGAAFDPGYQYNSRIGLMQLLTSLTPDSKALTLAALGGENYFSSSDLIRGVNTWMTTHRVAEPFPVVKEVAWSFFQHNEKDGSVKDGSLLEIGAAVKETHLPTPKGYQTGYRRSLAGEELIVPLVQRAVDFVYQVEQASESDGVNKPKFSSMSRLLSAITSTNPSERRPLVVFDVVKHLADSNQESRAVDIVEAAGKHHSDVVNLTLVFLGSSGIIDYKSIGKEVEGKRPVGWSLYQITGDFPKDLDVSKIYEGKEMLPPRGLLSALDKSLGFISNHPKDAFNLQNLASGAGISETVAGRVLTALKAAGVLEKRPESLDARNVHSIARANRYTHMFYDIVLNPALRTAEDLQPQSLGEWSGEKLDLFISNYKTERSQKGANEAKMFRESIFAFLSAKGRVVKLGDIAYEVNQTTGRELNKSTVRYHLNLLMAEGLVSQLEPGMFQANEETK